MRGLVEEVSMFILDFSIRLLAKDFERKIERGGRGDIEAVKERWGFEMVI